MYFSTGLFSCIGLVTILTLVEPVSGQCSSLTLSGSSYSGQTGLDGQYQLLYGFYCNDLVIYEEQYSSLPPNYIYGALLQNATQLWFIGTQLCRSVDVFAKNTAGHDYTYPYNLPSGTWQEWNPSANTFVSNPNITVTCNSDLSPGAIVGIVIGSVCGAIILLSLIGSICRSVKYKKRRQTMAQTAVEMPPVTVANYASAYPNTAYYPQPVFGPGPHPSDFDPAYATVVGDAGGGYTFQPPPYDSQKPPEYTVSI